MIPPRSLPLRVDRLLAWTALGLGASSAGCAAAAIDVVRDTAAVQWSCPAPQIAVDDRGAGHFEASGCGRRGRFATHPRTACPSPGCPGSSQGI
jgi:hypothetical protein